MCRTKLGGTTELAAPKICFPNKGMKPVLRRWIPFRFRERFCCFSSCHDFPVSSCHAVVALGRLIGLLPRVVPWPLGEELRPICCCCDCS